MELSSDTSICYSSTLEIIIDDIYSSYLWNNGETSNSIVVDQAGTYFVTVTSETGCQVSDTINVGFIPLPYIDVGNILNLCSNDTINLVFSDDWISTLLLNFENGDTISENTPINIDAAGQYQIFVTDSLGCIGFDIFEVVEDLNPMQILNTHILVIYYQLLTFHIMLIILNGKYYIMKKLFKTQLKT